MTLPNLSVAVRNLRFPATLRKNANYCNATLQRNTGAGGCRRGGAGTYMQRTMALWGGAPLAKMKKMSWELLSDQSISFNYVLLLLSIPKLGHGR